MTAIEKLAFLYTVPAFNGLHTHDLYHILGITHEVSFDDGHVLFNQGAPGECMYIIVAGSIEIYGETDAGRNKISELKQNDIVGEMALFDDLPRSASAICNDKCQCLIIKKQAAQELLIQYPTIALGILRTMSKKMRDLMASTHKK